MGTMQELSSEGCLFKAMSFQEKTALKSEHIYSYIDKHSTRNYCIKISNILKIKGGQIYLYIVNPKDPKKTESEKKQYILRKVNVKKFCNQWSRNKGYETSLCKSLHIYVIE